MNGYVGKFGNGVGHRNRKLNAGGSKTIDVKDPLTKRKVRLWNLYKIFETLKHF